MLSQCWYASDPVTAAVTLCQLPASSPAYSERGHPASSLDHTRHPIMGCSSEQCCNGELALAQGKQLGGGGCRAAELPAPQLGQLLVTPKPDSSKGHGSKQDLPVASPGKGAAGCLQAELCPPKLAPLPPRLHAGALVGGGGGWGPAFPSPPAWEKLMLPGKGGHGHSCGALYWSPPCSEGWETGGGGGDAGVVAGL